MTIALTKKVGLAADVLVNLIDGEAVFLDMKSENYFGLDEVGTRMWEALTTTGSVGEAFERLLLAYEVDGEQLRSDLEDLIGQLREHGLLEVVDG